MNINLIYGEYFSERSPHFFLHFAVHRADCLQILRDKSQLGLRGADSIVEENFSSANISSSAHKSPHLPKTAVPSPRLALTKSVSQAYFSTLPKITSATVSFPLCSVISNFLSASFLCIFPCLFFSLPLHSLSCLSLSLSTCIFHRASRVSQSPPFTLSF